MEAFHKLSLRERLTLLKPLARRKPRNGWLAIRKSTGRLSAATGIETLEGLLRFLGGGANLNDA